MLGCEWGGWFHCAAMSSKVTNHALKWPCAPPQDWIASFHA